MGLSQDLINPEHCDHAEDFECVICREFVIEPRVCNRCKKLFCTICIKEWLDKNEKCPFKCSAEKMELTDITDEQQMTYMLIQIKCTKSCEAYVSLIEYKDHLATCNLNSCPNFENCNRKACYFYKGASYCSYFCYKTIQYNAKDEKTEKDSAKLASIAGNAIYKRGFPYKWNFKKSSSNLTKISKNSLSLDKEESKIFKTAVSSVGFLGGFGKVKFRLKNPSFHFKIGVTSTLDFDPDQAAFCDLETGFAFYSIGQTRNGSHVSGLLYGERLPLSKELVVEMEVNMGEGKLNFWVDGKNLGSAFEELELTHGPIYPAIAIAKSVDEVQVFTD